MRKLLAIALTTLSCGAAYALPVGNPAEASLLCDGLFLEGHCGDCFDPCLSWCEAWSFRAGFYGDYVFNRHFKIAPPGQGSRVIDHSTLSTNAAYLAFNILERVDIFANLGATAISLEGNAILLGRPGDIDQSLRFFLQTNSAFSWGVGGRATLWELGCTSFGLEGQYFQTRPNLQRLVIGDFVTLNLDTLDAQYSEWQVGFGLSHRINIFVPYVAVKWAGGRWEFDNLAIVSNDLDVSLVIGDVRPDKHWGWAVGVSLIDNEKASVTVEGRFADERAVYVNGQIRF